jgi:hypothetical protein
MTKPGFEERRLELFIEEAANKIYPNDEYRNEYYCDMGELHREKFIEGAKWMMEQLNKQQDGSNK